jgi:hypothetical protein
MLTFVHLDAEESEQVDSRLENLFPLKFRSTPRGTIGHIRKRKRKRKRKELTLAIGGCFSHGYAFLTSLFLVKKVNK